MPFEAGHRIYVSVQCPAELGEEWDGVAAGEGADEVDEVGVELYPEVVDVSEKEDGVPSRLIKTDRPRGAEKGRHAMVDVRRLPAAEENGVAGTLDDLAREGARRMIAMALDAEVGDYIEALRRRARRGWQAARRA